MKTPNISKKSALLPEQKEHIFDIWNRVYPTNVHYDSMMDFEAYLDKMGRPSHYLSLDDQGSIIGWLVAFDRDDERWFAMIIRDKAQGRGFGSSLLNEAKNDHKELVGWVVDHENYIKANGSAYPSPINFYLKFGFQILDERFPGKHLDAVKIKYTRVS